MSANFVSGKVRRDLGYAVMEYDTVGEKLLRHGGRVDLERR
jgi:hypothetical protein